MSHRHKVKIQKLFEHPVSGNIDGKKVVNALEHYGIKITTTKHNKIKLHFNDKEQVLAIAHHATLTKDTIVKLRNYLESIGLTPDTIE